MTAKPKGTVIGITTGDPNGIGPEIVVKALATHHQDTMFRVYGSRRTLVEAANGGDVDASWLLAQDPSSRIRMVDVGSDNRKLGYFGRRGPTSEGGFHSWKALEQAIADAQRTTDDPERIDALVTAPISKTSWKLAGGMQPHVYAKFPGHTELLADAFDSPGAGMLFVGPTLRVLLVTIHEPLMHVGTLITEDRVLASIRLADRACKELRCGGRIGVCGLNPHAGEDGLLGEEDGRVILPAIRRACAEGVDATGPWPADTLFRKAARLPAGLDQFDIVVAMYHDQGLIPAKLIDGEKCVNVTVGLKNGFIRTSPAHGTAFDIAGKNLASPVSMIEAIRLAEELASRV